MDLHKAYKKFLKRGKTITDGSCRMTIENKKFLIVERIYESVSYTHLRAHET